MEYKIKSLRRENEQLEIDIIKIESQLLEAKQNLKMTGEYASADWYKKANYALKMKRIQLKHNNEEIINLHRQRNSMNKEIRQRNLERQFMDIAKEILAPGVFQQMLNEAILRANKIDR